MKEKWTRFPDESDPMSAVQLTCKLTVECVLMFLNCKIDFAIKISFSSVFESTSSFLLSRTVKSFDVSCSQIVSISWFSSDFKTCAVIVSPFQMPMFEVFSVATYKSWWVWYENLRRRLRKVDEVVIVGVSSFNFSNEKSNWNNLEIQLNHRKKLTSLTSVILSRKQVSLNISFSMWE